MSYRNAEPVEREEDALTFRLLPLYADSDVRQSIADALLIWSKVIEGEDGTLRVVC